MNALEEQARKSFLNHRDSVKEFKEEFRNIAGPTDINEALAKQAIMRDAKLSFLTLTTWVRQSERADLNEIRIDDSE